MIPINVKGDYLTSIETIETLDREDLKKLEKYIKNVNQYRKLLKFRGYEIMENHEPENIGAGKSNLPGRPIEREVIKKLGDRRYNELDNIVSSVEKLLDEADEETYDIIVMAYYDMNTEHYTWEDIADRFYTSKTTILRRRATYLKRLAEIMDYIN